MELDYKKPKVKLIGKDGNAYNIIGIVSEAMKRAGASKEVVKQFQEEATSGDYDNVLSTCMKYVDVE